MEKLVLKRIGWVAASLGLTTALVGCGAASDANAPGTQDNALAAVNGLAAINGLAGVNGLAAVNGLAGVNGLANVNGLAVVNGLASVNGLAATNGLMTSSWGRRTVAYMAKCALSSGDSLVKQDQNGTNYTYPGAIGLAPNWKTGGCTDQSCQELVSACLMAHVNSAGMHVPIYLVGPGSVGWGQSSSYPNQEGSFFGNIMVSNPGFHGPNLPNPVADYCNGESVNSAVVPGRLGANFDPNTPYKNPFPSTFGGACVHPTGAYRCDDSSQTTNGNPDGYTNCRFTSPVDNSAHVWNNVLTVYRAPTYTPVFDSGYYYQFLPSSGNIGMAMDLTHSDYTNGALLNQFNYDTNKDNQKFSLVPAGNGNYFFKMKANSGKCFDVNGAGNFANNSTVEIWDCNGGDNQKWTISTSASNDGSLQIKNVASGRCLDNQNTRNASAPLVIYDCHSATDGWIAGQNWAIAATQ